MSTRQGHVKEIGAFHVDRNCSLAGFDLPLVDNFRLKILDAGHEAFLEYLQSFAFLDGHIGEHRENFRFGIGPDQEGAIPRVQSGGQCRGRSAQ